MSDSQEKIREFSNSTTLGITFVKVIIWLLLFLRKSQRIPPVMFGVDHQAFPEYVPWDICPKICMRKKGFVVEQCCMTYSLGNSNVY